MANIFRRNNPKGTAEVEGVETGILECKAINNQHAYTVPGRSKAVPPPAKLLVAEAVATVGVIRKFLCLFVPFMPFYAFFAIKKS